MSKNNNAPKRKIFGRNLFTLAIFLPVLIILILGVFITVNYISAYNSSKINPFVDKDADNQFIDKSTSENSTYDYAALDAKTVKGDSFNELGVIFKFVELNEDGKKASFELRVYKNENSKKISGDIKANVCLAANWVEYVGYASKSNSIKLAADKDTAESSSTYKKSFSITNVIDFPAKADTWPVKVKVDEPTIYLYLEYTYVENGSSEVESFILKYNYKDLQPETGGIRK